MATTRHIVRMPRVNKRRDFSSGTRKQFARVERILDSMPASNAFARQAFAAARTGAAT